uniref:Kringle domain-containing protein n=1 Tax=Denticeps clupeoides TaxID=299321 RepID=A0AAY4ESW1_9TELE
DVYTHVYVHRLEFSTSICHIGSSNYYWSTTRGDGEYCSNDNGYDYKDIPCKNSHPCGRHEMIYYSSTYHEECLDDCRYDREVDYYWCTTEQGWDYCSPQQGVTYKDEQCPDDCSENGEKYTWCKTRGASWNFCGSVEPAECLYVSSTRRKRQSGNSGSQIPIHEFPDGENRQIVLYAVQDNNNCILNGRCWSNNVDDCVNRWHSCHLVTQARSNLIQTRYLRIDMQGMAGGFHNFQIQLNCRRNSGQSTTIAQVLIPQNQNIPEEHIRLAFRESFQRSQRVRVVVREN